MASDLNKERGPLPLERVLTKQVAAGTTVSFQDKELPRCVQDRLEQVCAILLYLNLN